MINSFFAMLNLLGFQIFFFPSLCSLILLVSSTFQNCLMASGLSKLILTNFSVTFRSSLMFSILRLPNPPEVSDSALCKDAALQELIHRILDFLPLIVEVLDVVEDDRHILSLVLGRTVLYVKPTYIHETMDLQLGADCRIQVHMSSSTDGVRVQ